MANRVVVDEMVIKLRADAGDFQKDVKNLKSQYKDLDISNSKEAVKVSRTMSSVTTGMKGMIGNFLKLLGGFTILKEIISGLNKVFNEGRDRFYSYSKITNGSFSKAVDDRNSKLVAMGNAFAAFESLLTQAISPFLAKAFEGFAEFFNELSKILAQFMNLPSYYKANLDIFSEWKADLTQTKALISGIDKLNIFQGKKRDRPQGYVQQGISRR